LEQNADHTQTESGAEEQQLSRILQGLWDKVRRSGELITELRSQNSDLGQRASVLEREISRVKAQLSARYEAVRSLTDQLKAAGDSNNGVVLNGERDSLVAKVRELLARIDGYL